MQTSIKSLAVALSFGIATLTSSVSFAEDNKAPEAASYQSSMYANNEGRLKIALDKQIGSAVSIRLTSQGGQILFHQRVSKRANQSRVCLNLSELPDGVYQVEITNGVNTEMHTLTLSTAQPQTPSRQVSVQ